MSWRNINSYMTVLPLLTSHLLILLLSNIKEQIKVIKVLVSVLSPCTTAMRGCATTSIRYVTEAKHQRYRRLDHAYI